MTPEDRDREARSVSRLIEATPWSDHTVHKDIAELTAKVAVLVSQVQSLRDEMSRARTPWWQFVAAFGVVFGVVFAILGGVGSAWLAPVALRLDRLEDEALALRRETALLNAADERSRAEREELRRMLPGSVR